MCLCPPPPLATAIMEQAVRKWPQLNRSVVGLSSEAELVQTLLENPTQSPSGVCQMTGRAGGGLGRVCIATYSMYHYCDVVRRVCVCVMMAPSIHLGVWSRSLML